MCEPFKSEVSVSYSPLALLNVSPTVFQSQRFWGFSFPVQVPCAGGPRWGSDPILFTGSSVVVIPLLLVSHCAGAVGPD